ncbi:MAG: dihydroorotase [Oscillospiraceae bacterium]
MLIKNARLVDANGEMYGDICIENGTISSIGKELFGEGPVIDANGRTVLPAFIDLHCHFRTPGYEYKEDIMSGSRSAAAGGYTFVNCMANTNPVCSNGALANEIMAKAKEINTCDVNQVVSLTKNMDGQTLDHLETLPDNIRIISDDGCGVQSAAVMVKAMQIAARKGLLIMSHAEDKELSPTDYRLAENVETVRNLYIASTTRARLHMSHVSTSESLKAVALAKQAKINVTCEVTPHHLFFYDNDYKVNPPIRSKEDVDCIIDLIKKNIVDAIATDHAPHTDADKLNGAAGMVGLETAFGACYTKLCIENDLPLSTLSRMMSANPAKLLGLNKGLLRPGYDGDIVIVDTSKTYVVHKEQFHGKSQNTLFDGIELTGKVELTAKSGEITFVTERK